ncbi:DUF3757 domain-containing protein [Vibrio caribbeanicus]|uniref:DUF3757 domain-containing protein n=1 Tax=Vibrio caribbeanicus TaxID=701175 RepID=UPI0030D879D4
MNVKLIVFISCFSTASSVFANTVLSCPEPESITVINHTYSSYNLAGNWIGLASPGNRGEVLSFKEALIYDFQPLKLQKCTYNLDNKGLVDLFLDENRDRAISITQYQSQWQRVNGAWYDSFECRTQAGDCQFEFSE